MLAARINESFYNIFEFILLVIFYGELLALLKVVFKHRVIIS